MSSCPFASRRRLLGAAGAALTASTLPARARADGAADDAAVAFHGLHQAGIATPQQSHILFASFDLIAEHREGVADMLRRWTAAAARMTAGQPAEAAASDPSLPPPDSFDALGLAPQRLTLTFGFGPGLFTRDGRDRYGLRAKRPAALVDLPRFAGDQLDPAYSGGDLCIQACADDPAVTFHAIRQLARMAAPSDAAQGYGGKPAGRDRGVAVLRWMQAGFLPRGKPGETPRNLLGFRDGTQTPGSPHPAARDHGKLIGNGTLADVVWANDGGGWMQGGSYLVARRIRIALQHWDNVGLDFQEQVIGRRKLDGGPLSGGGEFAPLDLDAMDADGNPVIDEHAHVRLGSAASTGGARILRRGYSYTDGLGMIAERWPPWRQGLAYEAGLFFIAFQRDPRTGFIRMFETMAKLDLLNQFTTHIGSAIFACPRGAAPGEFIGQDLFAA